MRLFTIGYEGAEIAEFLATLADHGISQVIDVRDVPISRKRGFSKNKLREALAGYGIEYLHLKGLGDPKPGREAARAGRFAAFRSIYGKHLESSVAQTALKEARSAAARQVSCLLCFERSNENCHRSIVADHLARSRQFDVCHIGVQASSINKRKAAHDRPAHNFAVG
ncbi:MAG TPA: DUF488 domain-containing protein [Rhizomicrobium sp.]|nr:DUF488 domain-containing protein [Rhizomicrobium sp.]